MRPALMRLLSRRTTANSARQGKINVAIGNANAYAKPPLSTLGRIILENN
jgi:hypothetical protein